jgi:hypothetical protein
MSLGAAVLRGDALAWGRVADIVRQRGGTYNDTFEVVCGIFEKAGREKPTLADFDEKMYACDAAESGR